MDREKIAFDLQVEHFVDVVRNGAAPSCTGGAALSAMVVYEAVKRAIKNGEPIKIDGFEIKEGLRNIPSHARKDIAVKGYVHELELSE